MSLYLAEYKTCLPDGKGGFVSVMMPFEADTIQLAQRQVEGVIATGCMETATLYQAVKEVSARRVVTSCEMGGKGVVIGSALVAGDGDT